MKNIPLTYHIGSLLLYMTCGFLLALVITPPAVYLCSASTLLYQIFAEDRKIRGYGEADDDLLT